MIEIQPQLHLQTREQPDSISSGYYNPTTTTAPPHDDIFRSLESTPFPLITSKVADDIPGPSYTKSMSTVGQYCYTFFLHHLHNPYPTLQEKQAIVDEALCSQVTLTSVSNWFTNSRRRCGWIDTCNEYFKGDTKAMVEVCAHVLVNGGTKRTHDPQGVVERILSIQAKVKAWDEEQTKLGDWVVDLANLLHEITLEEECEFRSSSQALYGSTSDSHPSPRTGDAFDLDLTTLSQITARNRIESKKRGREEDHAWEAEAQGLYRCVSWTSTISTSPSEGPSEPESIFSSPPSVLEDDGHSAGIKRQRGTSAFENELDHTYAFESPETNLLGLCDFPFTFATSFDSPMIPSPEISEKWIESAPLNHFESNKRSRSQFETDDFIPSKKSKLNHCLQMTTSEANTPLSINTESERSFPIISGQEIPLFQVEGAHQNSHKVDISPLDESWELDVNVFDWASFMSGLSEDGLVETSDNTHHEEELDLSLAFLQDMVSPELNEQELHLNGDLPVSTDPEVGSLPSFDKQEYIQSISDNHVHCGGDGRRSGRRSQGPEEIIP